MSKLNILLCTSCHGTHDLARDWFVKNHAPAKGWNNFTACKSAIGDSNVCIRYCSCNFDFEKDEFPLEEQEHTFRKKAKEAAAELGMNGGNQAVLANRPSNSIITINSVTLGSAACPSELVRVRTELCDYLVQIWYDSGAQVSVCNYQCGPLVTATRVSPRSIGITSINGISKKVRQIHQLSLGNGNTAEAILIPNMDLKVTLTGKPKCWDKYNELWAYQDDGNNGPIGQLLLGADCTRLFPIPVISESGSPVMTENCILQKSKLTGRYIIFGTGKQEDKEIQNDTAYIKTMTADNSDYKPYDDDSDFSLFWPHTDDAFPEDIVTIPGEGSE